jgi:hypothetical protein
METSISNEDKYLYQLASLILDDKLEELSRQESVKHCGVSKRDIYESENKSSANSKKQRI